MRFTSVLLLLFAVLPLMAQSDTYSIVIEGFDWGPAVTKVIIPYSKPDSVGGGAENWKVSAMRTHASGLNQQGDRQVVSAYASDSRGRRLKEGDHTTLVLAVGPHLSIDNPITYLGDAGRNVFIRYSLDVTHIPTVTSFATEDQQYFPGLKGIDLSGEFEHTDGTALTYAHFTPEASDKRPLIVWLHGGGEGGTDTRIPLLANRATAYAEEATQAIMGGAYVLWPQAPSYWMETTGGKASWGEEESRFTPALLALIESYVADRPGVDRGRIYVGGCSNGGFMTLKLLLRKPGYFAAGFPSALAYRSKNLSDAEIAELATVPLWFVHAEDDPVTLPLETVVPTVSRLEAAGAADVHFSYFDHVTDLTGLYGGEDYWYNGHFSWVPCHANACWSEVNGEKITIMEWLAKQER